MSKKIGAVFFILMLFASRGAFSQERGVDLGLVDVGIEVIRVDDETYEIVWNGLIVQHEGYTPRAVLVYGTEWDAREQLLGIDDGETPFSYGLVVPPDYAGQRVEAFVEVWPEDRFEYDDTNNHVERLISIPALPIPQQPDEPSRSTQSNGGESPSFTIPDIPLWPLAVFVFLLVFAMMVQPFWQQWRFGFTLSYNNLQLQATQKPPSNPKKNQLWVKKELSVQPTRWKLDQVHIQTRPQSGNRQATRKFVDILSEIIDVRKRQREEQVPFWQHNSYEDFVEQAYPIRAKQAWLDARIRQVQVTVTFTLYRFTGSEWRKILSKDFSRRGQYHYIIPLQSFPQRYETANQELRYALSELVDELVSWPFKG